MVSFAAALIVISAKLIGSHSQALSIEESHNVAYDMVCESSKSIYFFNRTMNCLRGLPDIQRTVTGKCFTDVFGVKRPETAEEAKLVICDRANFVARKEQMRKCEMTESDGKYVLSDKDEALDKCSKNDSKVLQTLRINLYAMCALKRKDVFYADMLEKMVHCDVSTQLGEFMADFKKCYLKNFGLPMPSRSSDIVDAMCRTPDTYHDVKVCRNELVGEKSEENSKFVRYTSGVERFNECFHKVDNEEDVPNSSTDLPDEEER